MWDFIRDWFREWWGLMGCAAFTFLGIWQAAASKSNAWVVVCSATLGTALFFVASYKAWNRQRERAAKAEARLVPRLVITEEPTPRVWPAGQAGVIVTGKEYYMEVFNSSDADAIEGAVVEIVDLKPDALGFKNATLHIRNENDERYGTREATIYPGSSRQWDLITGPVNAPNSQVVMIIPHVMHRYREPIPIDVYEMTVHVSARNVAAKDVTFKFWVADNELQCVRIHRDGPSASEAL